MAVRGFLFSSDAAMFIAVLAISAAFIAHFVNTTVDVISSQNRVYQMKTSAEHAINVLLFTAKEEFRCMYGRNKIPVPACVWEKGEVNSSWFWVDGRFKCYVRVSDAQVQDKIKVFLGCESGIPQQPENLVVVPFEFCWARNASDSGIRRCSWAEANLMVWTTGTGSGGGSSPPPPGNVKKVVIIPVADDDKSFMTKDADCSKNPKYRYYACDHPCEPTDWHDPEFDDSAWPEGEAPFGYDKTPSCTKALDSAPDDLFVRKQFYIPNIPDKALLNLSYDDGIRCYINGEIVVDRLGEGHGPQYWNAVVDIDVDYLKQGENLLACWVANGGENGGMWQGYFDAELVVWYK